MNTLLLYGRLMRFDRPIGILLLLWPTLTALWIAHQGPPSVHLLVIFGLGVVIMRAAGCVVNDIFDQDFDKYVQRTKNRPLASGQLSSKKAVRLLFALLMVAFLIVCFTNIQTIFLSFVALALACCYPLMKRYTHWPQIVLGLAFAWAIPMAFSASQAPLSWSCWLLFAATVVWALAYDTLYAMVDKEDDIKIGIKSTAVLMAPYDKVFVLMCHCTVLSLYLIIGRLLYLSYCFYIAIGIAFGLTLYQQWLIRHSATAGYFRAFLNNNVFGMVLFCGILLSFSA